MKRGESIGFLYCENGLGKEEKILLKLAKKKNIKIELINISKDINEKELYEKIKNCGIIYNNTAEDFGIEIAKTIEEMGKKIIDSPEVYYFTEDKWLFYLKCREKNIPVPETILLSENINIAKKEIKEFNKWPVILKRIYGTLGEYVDKADNLLEAEKIIKKFWKKGSERIPVIAQEYIKSPSYRVTVIGDKIVQTAIKENHGWKSTGTYEKKFRKFEVDSELKKIIKKIKKFSGINVCGIDFLKKDGRWIVLEINAEPGFDFRESERKKLLEELLNFLADYK